MSTEQLPDDEFPPAADPAREAAEADLAARVEAAEEAVLRARLADAAGAVARAAMRFPLDQLVADLQDPADSVPPADTTGVLVTWSDEDEVWFVLGGAPGYGPGDHVPADGAFWVDAPADQVQAHEDAKAKYSASLAMIVVAAGLDPEGVGLAVVCEAWQGEVHENRPMVAVHTPGRPNEVLFWAPDIAAAAARIGAMPERLHLLGPRGEVEVVNRSALEVRPQAADPWRTMCHRCGHPYDVHGAAATSVEAP